jgi:hypothetical protein
MFLEGSTTAAAGVQQYVLALFESDCCGTACMQVMDTYHHYLLL